MQQLVRIIQGDAQGLSATAVTELNALQSDMDAYVEEANASLEAANGQLNRVTATLQQLQASHDQVVREVVAAALAQTSANASAINALGASAAATLQLKDAEVQKWKTMAQKLRNVNAQQKQHFAKMEAMWMQSNGDSGGGEGGATAGVFGSCGAALAARCPARMLPLPACRSHPRRMWQPKP